MPLIGRLRRRRLSGERGTALVEMVIALPLLVVLAFGVAEASWALAQQHAVRSVAREGARIAASHPGNTPSLVAKVCDVDDIIGTATFEATGLEPFKRGARGFFEVTVGYDPLTSFFPFFNGVTLIERVVFNVELDTRPGWWPLTGGGATC